MSNPYSQNDIDFIILNYCKMHARLIASHLGRSRLAISQTIHRLKLKGLLPKKTIKESTTLINSQRLSVISTYLEKQFDKPIYDILYNLYVVEKLSQRDIQKKFGVCLKTVRKLLKKNNIQIRYGSEAIRFSHQTKPRRGPNGNGYTILDGYKLLVMKNNKRPYYPEHRYIMEQHIGRKLKKNEVVHHIDGDTLNNDINNLKLMTAKQHNSLSPNSRNGLIRYYL
jgi:transposase